MTPENTPDVFAALIEKVVTKVVTSLQSEHAQAGGRGVLSITKADELRGNIRHKMHDDTLNHGQSVRQVAAHLGVGARKIRWWIKTGLLDAIDVGSAGRAQLRIMPEAVVKLLHRLAVGKPRSPRRRRERIDPEIEKILSE